MEQELETCRAARLEPNEMTWMSSLHRKPRGWAESMHSRWKPTTPLKKTLRAVDMLLVSWLSVLSKWTPAQIKCIVSLTVLIMHAAGRGVDSAEIPYKVPIPDDILNERRNDNEWNKGKQNKLDTAAAVLLLHNKELKGRAYTTPSQRVR
jgi:hypothetical protein